MVTIILRRLSLSIVCLICTGALPCLLPHRTRRYILFLPSVSGFIARFLVSSWAPEPGTVLPEAPFMCMFSVSVSRRRVAVLQVVRTTRPHWLCISRRDLPSSAHTSGPVPSGQNIPHIGLFALSYRSGMLSWATVW